MMDDLTKMFMATESTKRDDFPPDFLDNKTVYAWAGNSIVGYVNYYGDWGEFEQIYPDVLTTELPQISQDGRCLVFDGNCGMRLTSVGITLPITIEFYAYNRSFIDWSCLMYFTMNNQDTKKIQIGLQSNDFRVEVKDGAAYSKTVQAATAAQNKWQHYAAVVGTTGHRLYINGQKVFENFGVVNPSLTLNTLNIGGKSREDSFPWIGALYQLRVSRGERYTDNFTVDLSDMPIPTTGTLELGYTSNGLIAQYDGIYNTQAGHGAGKTWVDISGNNNHLSMDSNVYYSANVGFDSNSFFNKSITTSYWWESAIIEKIGALREYTIEFVCKPTSDGTTAGRDFCIINQQNSSPYMMGGMELYTSGALWYEAIDNNLYNSFKTETIPIGQNTHTAVVFKDVEVGQIGKVAYKDGVEIGDATRLGTSLARTGQRINVGGRSTNNSTANKFVGHIYAVRIYDRALTAAEVAANYQIDKARFGL